MSFGYATPRQTTAKIWQTDPAYVRPSEWIALTPVGSTEQKFTGIYAVYPNNEDNYVALIANVSSGNYTIDWGDGTTENIASGTQANHQYTYASVSNLTSYGYKQVTIIVTAQTTNLTQVNIRARPNYSGVGTGVQWPAKWLDIEVGSPNLTSLVIGANNATIGLPLLQRIRWASKSATYTSMLDFFYWCVALQNIIFDCNMSNVTSINAMFYNCQALQYGPNIDTTSVTDMSNMFGNCYNLISVPTYKTPALTSLSSAFANCYKLISVGFTSTANVTSMSSTFLNCYELRSIQTLDFQKNIAATSTFQNARNLVSLNIINAGNCNNYTSLVNSATALVNLNISGSVVVGNINMSSICNGCVNLTDISLPNTANVTNLSVAFNNCSSLTSLPVTYTPNVINFNQAYGNCINIRTVANINTSNATNMVSMFQNLIQLQDAPNVDTTKVTTVQNMYSGCLNLRSLPAYNLANIVVSGGQILGAGGTGLGTSTPITTSNVTGVRFTIAYNQTNQNNSALTTVINNLGTSGAATQFLTITGNPGADTALSKTATWINTSNVMTMANTVGVTVGTQVTGANVVGNISATLTSNKISVVTFMDSNAIISLSTVTTSNALANTWYYTSNRSGAGPYTYDVSTTQGGTPITFTNGTANMNVNVLVATVNTNANVILNSYPIGNGTAATATTRVLNTQLAVLKGWTVSG